MTQTNEILEFAINEEAAAAKFYRELAEKVEKPWMKNVLISFAKEEEGHKKKLERVLTQGFSAAAAKAVTDLKISDYLVDIEASDDISYQDALIVAAKKEKAAFRLYSDLAEKMDDPELKQVLLFLAQEEAKHKLRFEVEYDEQILLEN
jgi:rubrerythrin